MKKNQKTYLLLGTVLAIWGILGFRIVKTLNPPEEKTEIIAEVVSDTLSSIIKRDTFSISADYRDPFLGTMPKKAKKVKNPKKKKPVAPKRQITYQGSVAQNGSKTRLFFISIDGQQFVFEKGKAIDGVTLVWGNQKTIKVTYTGHTETHTLE